ncbi:hypothetical protein HC928_15850 [bacterium]|nr:hypothetical protein [bacterium]
MQTDPNQPPQSDLRTEWEPTPTPPANLDAQLTLGTQASPDTTIGDTIAIVAGGDTAGLRLAVIKANNAEGKYDIYLQAGTYFLTETLVFYGDTSIYGRGVGLTHLRQAAASGYGGMNGLIVVQGPKLRLDNLRLTGGRMTAYSESGGAVWVRGSNSTLRVTNTVFEDNAAAAGGAVYIASAASGSQFTNSVFKANTAVIGSALANFSSSTQIRCVKFVENGLAAALYNGAQNAQPLRNNTFKKNTYGHVVNGASTTLDAQQNFWKKPDMPNKVENRIDSRYAGATPYNCPMDPPKPVPNLPTSYNYVIVEQGGAGYGSWSTTERTAIELAIDNVGRALDRVSQISTSPSQAFNRVYTKGGIQTFDGVLFLRADTTVSIAGGADPDVQINVTHNGTMYSLLFLDVSRGVCKSYEAQTVTHNGVSHHNPNAVVCNGNLGTLISQELSVLLSTP